MVMCFGCSHFREPTCVTQIRNFDSGLEWLCVLDALNSENIHVGTTSSTWIQVLNGCVFWMLSIPRVYMCEPDSHLGFMSLILWFFGCSQFREPTCVNKILNLDSGLEWLCVLDALNSESLHVRTTFSTWIQVLNGCVFWMLSIPRAYMCEPDSQLRFRSLIVLCFGCSQFRDPTCVNHILNLDSGLEWLCVFDALNSESLH